MKLWIPECGVKNDDDNIITIKVIVVLVGKLPVVVYCLFRS